jgi:hypothetical protein
MLSPLLRKAAQVASDPVLRRWLIARASGRETGPPAFTAGAPPYLNGLARWTAAAPLPQTPLEPLNAAKPTQPIDIALPGATVRLTPERPHALFTRDYDDLETALAAYRFAWVPVMGDAAPPAWVDATWRAFRRRFARPDSGWAWHAYTAAERAINILDFAQARGVPGERDDTVAFLAAHAEAIAGRLEYFGEHYTSNHLSNDARGLFRIGLALGLGRWADLGGRILLAEAARIFRPSGILREGSSHYHALLTRNYASAWRAARAAGRPEADELEAIVRRAVACLPLLTLPGGFPLVGDISPDCSPEFVLNQLAPLIAYAQPADAGVLAADGWLRADFGPWCGLWHAAPDGWCPMPGHGHQDAGGFELHHRGTPLFRDLGRGSYTRADDAAATAHNGVTIDGRDPYPQNRPYYSAAFRRAVGTAPPVLTRDSSTVELHGPVSRIWKFDGDTLTIHDRIDGKGRHRITRRLHTALPVTQVGYAVRAAGFTIESDIAPSLQPATLWTAYGVGVPATAIVFEAKATLPYESEIRVRHG